MISNFLRFVGGGVRRSFLDLFRIGRIAGNIFDGLKHWLWVNRKLLPLVILGLLVFIPGIYFASSWLPKSKSRTPAIGASGGGASSLADFETDSVEDRLANLGNDAPIREGSTDADEGTAAEREGESEAPTGANASTLSDETQDALDGVLRIGRRMVSERQYSRASKILTQALDRHQDSSELAYLLVISQLANREYSEPGALLSDERFVNVSDPTWQVLYTSWLLYSPREAHTAAAAKLKETISLRRDRSSELSRIPAWFDARRGSYQRSLGVLAEVPASGERSFVDSLFYSVALTHAGDAAQALAFLTKAKDGLTEASKLDGLPADSTKSLAVKTCKGTITRALIRYTAKLESMAATAAQ